MREGERATGNEGEVKERGKEGGRERERERDGVSRRESGRWR